MTQQRHELSLQRQPVEVGRARRHVAQVFADVHEDARSTLQMLTSEIVTNAIAHGEGEIVLRTSRAHGEARIEVLDDSARAPQLGAAAADAEGGRGLMLVEALSSAWGVRRIPGRTGKSVWFTLGL